MTDEAKAHVIYQNPWITVREVATTDGAGARHTQPVIDTRVATGVVALTPDLQVYLVGQYRYAMREYSWEIIEGGGDHGEAPLLTAQRELKEEAGLAAVPWRTLGPPIHLSPPFSSEVGHLFVAEGLSHVGAEPEGTEDLSLIRVPLAEAIARVRQGEIKDGMSIIALLMLEQQLCADGRAVALLPPPVLTPLPTYPDPWRLVSSATQYEGAQLRVREDQVLRPDGQPGIYGVVSAGPCAALIVRSPDGKILLQRRARVSTGAETWELPSAVGPPGAVPTEVALRALSDLGDDSFSELRPLADALQLTNCHASDRAYLYVTDAQGPWPASDTERWLNPETAHAWVKDGEICDALSMIGVLLYG